MTGPGGQETYRNSVYFWLSVGGAATILAIGILAAIGSRLASPPLPVVWTVVALVVGILGAVWYALGTRNALIVSREEVVVRSKYATHVLATHEIESFDPDNSALANLRASGPRLLIRTSDDRTVVARAVLPGTKAAQDQLLATLNARYARAEAASG